MKKFFSLLAVLGLICALAGCETVQGYGGGPTPTVTQEAGGVQEAPDVGWQTQKQRHELEQESKKPPAAEETAPAPAATGPARKVTVSILLPLTGKKTALGQSMLKAAQMALFDIGARNLELIPRDTHGNGDGARQAAEAAVAAKSDLILGPVFAEDLKAVKPVAAAAGVPVIAFSNDATLADSNTYIMGFLPFAQVARVIHYAQGKDLRRFGLLAPQSEYADIVLRALKSAGAEVAPAVRAGGDLRKAARDFAAEAKHDGEIDAVVLPVGGEALRALVATLQNEGLRPPRVKWIGTGLWDDDAAGRAPMVAGGWFAAPDPSFRSDFERRYRSSYGAAPVRLASLAYDATSLAAVLGRTATEGAAPYTAAALTNPRGFSGVDGIFRFRGGGLSERGLAVLEAQPGAARVVDPAPASF